MRVQRIKSSLCFGLTFIFSILWFSLGEPCVHAQYTIETSPSLPAGPLVKGPDHPLLQPVTNKSVWAGLVAEYQDFGLPMPPPNAPLLLFERTIHPAIEPGHFLGFEVSPAQGRKPPVLLVGTELYSPDPTYLLPPEEQPWGLMNGKIVSSVTPFSMEPVKQLERAPDAIWMGSPVHVNACLATAIQLKSRGEESLSSPLLNYSLSVTGYVAFNTRSPLIQPAEWSPNEKLGLLGWSFWRNRLLDIKADERARALPFMQKILQRHPRLATMERTNLLNSLRLALRPPEGGTNKIEALVAKLRDDPGMEFEDPANLHYQITAFGFAAIPVLAGHLNDQCLTRSQPGDLHYEYGTGFWDSQPPANRHVLMRDRMAMLLEELMCKGVAASKRESHFSQEEVLEWLKTAEGQGEKQFYCEHAPKGWAAIVVLSEKYPLEFAGMLGKAVSGDPYQLQGIVNSFVRSSLPVEQKRTALLSHLRAVDTKKRAVLLRGLLKIDSEAFGREMVRALEALPSDATGAYWTCPEIDFARVVVETDSKEVWAAFEQYAHRATVGLRMELMNLMDYTYLGDRQKRQRLAFLSSFLEDTTLRDESQAADRFEGPHAGFTFKRMTVSQLAIDEMANLLRIPLRPRPDWTPQQWEASKEQVQTMYKGLLEHGH